MYTVTGLEPYNSKIKVSLDTPLTFLLYKSEVRKFQLTEGGFVDAALFHELMELLYLRARERALYLLDATYKTEKEIRDKLSRGLYPSEIIERVIAYLTEYLLVDDLRYAKMYIEYKRNTKSKKQIVQELYRKGVPREVMDLALEECELSDDDSLERLIEKRLPKYDMADIKSVHKFYQYLIGKGYSYGAVRQKLEQYTRSQDA